MLRKLFGLEDAPSPGWPPPNYYASRFTYARQMGEDAARGLTVEWPQAQRMLQGIWRQEAGGLTWAEAQPIIRYAFRLTRESLVKKDPA